MATTAHDTPPFSGQPIPSSPSAKKSCSFLERDLSRFGPNSSPENQLSLEEAREYCRQLAISHYENFSVASRLIPASLRQDFYNIYSYCRWSDDLADESANTDQAIERLDWWQAELKSCFAGRVVHPVFIALQSTFAQHRLDQQPFYDLLSAFRQDQTILRYDSDEMLQDYCRRSANPVGRILLQLAKVTDSRCYVWSDQICTSLQQINFAQDMSRDAEKGRIYLPRSRWITYGIDEAMILGCRVTEPLSKTICDWAIEQQDAFINGWELTNHVPAWLSRDIRLFAGGGFAIAQAILKKSGDVWSNRIELSKRDKFWIFAKAILSRKPPRKQSPIYQTPISQASARKLA